MSTRSGKRIHGSIHENIVKLDNEFDVKSERKTRNRRNKDDDVVVPKSKKRTNYVSYPIDEEPVNGQIIGQKTLKEHVSNIEVCANHVTEKVVRQTRRTKKLSENNTEDTQFSENVQAKKKNKKKKHTTQDEDNENEVPVVSRKSKKKKGRKANSTTDNQKSITKESTNLNKSNGSVDSFHSAAGSPLKEDIVKIVEKLNGLTKLQRRASKRLNEDNHESYENNTGDYFVQSCKKIKLSKDQVLEPDNDILNANLHSTNKKDTTFDKSNKTLESNSTLEIEPKRRRQSSTKNMSLNKIDTPLKFENSDKKSTPNKTQEAYSSSKKNILRSSINVDLNEINTNDNGMNQKSLNTTFEKPNRSKCSTVNTTFEKCEETPKTLNTTFAKSNDQTLNGTFDKPKRTRNSTLNNTFEKSNNANEPNINTTFEKSSGEPKLNSTFDKETKLNTTFDKNEAQSSAKSSLVTSDSSANLTFDKSDENSQISITSDDSRTDNIVNTTPVLIESSIDGSLMVLEPSPNPASDLTQAKSKLSATPLKREGTFTKDGPEVTVSPKPKVPTRTPVKRMSLPSPGSTPFPFSKSPHKEKSVLNVTHSIEKSVRRSSLTDQALRTTKVMFCSPVNNPAVVMQQKRKVIKSSMKGSNKSFVFDESVSLATGSSRKRSYTHNDAEELRCKRSRLAEDQQLSVQRLSRPRTSSAIVKLPEPSSPKKTPSKKTPLGKSEKMSRTKLPNFAALHQREFAKMESLDECQRRRAKRAQQLRTPNGAHNIIEKSSPKTKVPATEPPKVIKDTAKKPETPVKAKLPTLMSLKPGYTRFGFKMDTDVNPFSVPSKTAKPKQNGPTAPSNKVHLLRQPTQPSLVGTTTTRREVAKQMVMREKSSTSLAGRRDAARKEDRAIIKGVRTNRRFELQMRLRNVNA